MADTLRCPHCGALNRAEAEWCGQCYERLVEPEPEPEPEPESGPQVVPAATSDPGAAALAPGAIPESAIGTQRGAFKVTETGILWTCSRCDAENPLESQICEVCGAPFAETVRPKVERIQRDPGTATLISLFFPGAGHAYLGQWGQAVAR